MCILVLCVSTTDKPDSSVRGDSDATLFVARLGHQTTEGNFVPVEDVDEFQQSVVDAHTAKCMAYKWDT